MCSAAVAVSIQSFFLSSVEMNRRYLIIGFWLAPAAGRPFRSPATLPPSSQFMPLQPSFWRHSFFFFIIITSPLKVRCLRLCHTVKKASRGLYLFYLLSLPMLKICSRLFSLWTQTCRLTMLSLWPSSWIPCSLLGANLPWFHRGLRETTSVAGADSA